MSPFARPPILVIMTVILSMTNAAIGAPSSATVEQPRAFGYTVGDVLSQRILLPSGTAGSGSDDSSAAATPSTGRIGIWFERRHPRIETDGEGRRWMVVDYQIVNAPQTLITIALPALTLGSLQVPEWPVSVSPLTPNTAFGMGELQSLRPDRPAPLPAIAPLRRQTLWALGLLVLTLAAWFGWWKWRNTREAASLPFARAYMEMQRLASSQPDKNVRGWLCLHRALNETAGQVVHAGSLPGLLARAPHLQALQPQLERFYQQSGERFFASGSADENFPLLDLSRSLYRAERRQQQ
ncbi:calcium incorporation protein MxaA [Caballeronia sp. 15715]|uniref:calcium incorporation protein MxaA n=1 Tax=Caballeronia sp. 15715 TaxID=3391030 RepID=UPI0039E5BA5F